MEEGRSEIEFLPDEVLLIIFRYLDFKDLQLAEQVCERWKAVVETRFATVKFLNMRDNQVESDGVEVVKRCGPSLQTLLMPLRTFRNKFNGINYIAEAFPNLKFLSLTYLIIENEDFRTLSVKCRQLKRISFDFCTYSDEGLGLLLKALPGLQYLRKFKGTCKGDFGEVFLNACGDLHNDLIGISSNKCFSHLGGNLEELRVSLTKGITTAGLSQLFSKCKKLKVLGMASDLHCDELFSQWCQENTSVEYLAIENNSHITKLSFSQISRLSLLEVLELGSCDAVDSDTLIDISRGCLNLRRVILCLLPMICDRGVKSLSGCRNLSEFYCAKCNGVTENSLIQLSKSGRLNRILICNDWVSNSSCAAILGHCPQLEEFNVDHCKGVVDGIVDIAIEAMENRANGEVLHLHVKHTGVDPEKEIRTHPLLRVYRRAQASVSRIILN